jgi:imidazolonepropionase-like amidohydrolase
MFRLLLCATLALAATLVHAADTPAPATLITGARLIDGRGGAPQDDVSLLIRGERITMLGAGLRLKLPADTKVVDYHGKTLIPGLISDHSHVGLVDGIHSGTPDLYNRANVLRQLRQWQAYGVTTVTSLGINNPAVFYALRAPLHAGTLDGADLYGADRGIGVPNGAPPAKLMQVGADQLDRPVTQQQARAAVRAAIARHTDLIKLWVDDFNGTLPVKMSPTIYAAVIDEAHKNGLRVAAHIHDLADARRLVDAGVDILAHGVRDQPVDAPFIAALKKHHTWYIPTLQLNEAGFLYAQRPDRMNTPFFQHALQPELARQFADPAWRAKLNAGGSVAQDQAALAMNLKNFKTLYDAGVRIGFGTDSGATALRIPGIAEHRELALMVQAGITPLQAITLATGQAASLLELDDRGVLATGKLADFVVLDADPSQAIGNSDKIDAVWHRGRQVAGPIDTDVR